MEQKKPMTDAEMAQWNIDHPWTIGGLRAILRAVLDPRLCSDTLSYRARRRLGLVRPVGHVTVLEFDDSQPSDQEDL